MHTDPCSGRAALLKAGLSALHPEVEPVGTLSPEQISFSSASAAATQVPSAWNALLGVLNLEIPSTFFFLSFLPSAHIFLLK